MNGKSYKAFADDCQPAVQELYEKYQKSKSSAEKVANFGKVVSAGHPVTLDFDAMQQQGASGRRRGIRRRIMAPVWDFSAQGSWEAFEALHQAKVERAYKLFSAGRGPSKTEVSLSRGIIVTLDFKAMRQVSSTGRARDLRRRFE